MHLKTADELKALSPEQLEEEKSRVLREMESKRFSKDPERQRKVAKPTDPESEDVEEPTFKQMEDYLSQMERIGVEKNT